MKTILDAFIEISNSKESVEMIFNNYMIVSQKTLPSTAIAHNKLKSILKQNNKKSLIKKYEKMSGDTFIVLVKSIAQESLNRYKVHDDILGFLTSRKSGNLVNLEKLCVAILNFQNEIKDHLELIVKNHQEGLYLFNGIELFSQNEDTQTNNNLEKEVDNIKKSMNEMKKQLELLTKETNELKLENNELLNENKNVKKEVRKKTKEIEKKEIEKNSINKELIKIKKNLKVKDEEILKLKDTINNKNKILEEAIILDKFIIPKEINKNTCIIHTSPLLMVDKIHYDIKFIKYDSVYKDIHTYLKKLKSDGIFKVGIQSNEISSFKLQEIIEIGKEEDMKINRVFFNTEKELSEKLIMLK